MRLLAMVAALTLAVSAPVGGAPALTASGCPLFPADNVWHADVSRLPMHPRSEAYLAAMGTGAGIHADFGSGTWECGPIGIPCTVVPAGQARVPVRFGYAGESDPGPYPIPPDAPVEGGPDAAGDRHVLVQAMRTHGLVVADNGSSGFIGGVPDERWDSDALHQLRRVTLAGFEAVDTAPLRISPASPGPVAAAPAAGAAGTPGASSGDGALLPRVLTVVLGLTAAALATRAIRRTHSSSRHPRRR
jgi:hypothetical protein